MAKKSQVKRIRKELEKAMSLTKCRNCGCLKEALDHLSSFLSSLQTKGDSYLLGEVRTCLELLEPTKYRCLGCEYCLAAESVNLFDQAFSGAIEAPSSLGAFEVRQSWPVVPGEYLPFVEAQIAQLRSQPSEALGWLNPFRETDRRNSASWERPRQRTLASRRSSKTLSQIPRYAFLF